MIYLFNFVINFFFLKKKQKIGYQLRVVDNEDENDEETKSFKLQSKFDSYINWSHDFVSSRPDNFMKALEYLNVATEV